MEFARAPYNFIPLSKRVLPRYEDICDLPHHDRIEKDTLSGTIEYTVKAEGDLILSAGQSEEDKRKNEKKPQKFFKNTDGKYALPGSSIRGMIRNNVMTLGFCASSDDIEDSTYLYRSFATNIKNINKEYNDRLGVESEKSEKGKRYSILRNVKAGYIKCIGDDKYIITKAKVVQNRTYFRISEEELKKRGGNNIKGVNYFYSDNGRPNKNYYKPYTAEVRFSLNENTKFIKEIKYDNGNAHSLKFKGILLSSGFMNNKNGHYIINEKSNDEPINIPLKDINAYKEYYVKDKKNRNENGEKKLGFYELPLSKGQEKAVFYAEYNNRIYFGFTPYLRLFYDKSVYNGIPQSHKEKIIDYNKALFGFAEKEKAYKSRISFEDAVIEGKPVIENVKLTLQGPKPTCIAHYLKQNKKQYSTYNSDDFEISGLKFYWMKEVKAEAGDKERINSIEEVIKKGAQFKGKISFSNLHEDELGLLLYAICLKDGCYQQIGKGKPYGYGRIKIKDVDIQCEEFNTRYNDIFAESKKKLDCNELIQKYKDYVSEKLYAAGITDSKINIEDDNSIKILLKAKAFIGSGNKFEYMKINEFKDYKPLESSTHILNLNIQYEDKVNNKSMKSSQARVQNNSRNYNAKAKNTEKAINKNKKEINYNDNTEQASMDMLLKLQQKYNN